MENCFTKYMQTSKIFKAREVNTSDKYVDTHTSVQTNNNTSTQSFTQICRQECRRVCKYACLQSDMQTKGFLGCKYGFSFRQINLLSIVKNNPVPISYLQISKIMYLHFDLEISSDAVRGMLHRLRQKKLVETKVFHSGFARGNLYSSTTKVCKYIPSFYEQISMQTKKQNSMQTNHSIDRIDRNINLTILNQPPSELQDKVHLENLTDDEIAFRWENLSKYGFGKLQIKQIIEKLEFQGSSLENVMQGLHHAEWDLEHGQMKDKQGELVKSPLNWVYMILAKQGYYPRPKNYVSPIEQAEKDCQAEIVALEKAKANQEESAFQKWCANFSEEEKAQIIENKTSTMTRIERAVPPRIILKQCYADFLKSKEKII